MSKPVLRILPNMGDVTEGQDLTLVCSVQRGSLPIDFSWHHTKEEGALTSQTSDKLEASFKIPNVQAKHQGGYYCMSTNPAREIKQSQKVTIGGLAYSSRVENCLGLRGIIESVPQNEPQVLVHDRFGATQHKGGSAILLLGGGDPSLYTVNGLT